MAQQARTSAQTQLPQEAYQYASMYQLGNPLAVYRVSFRQSIILGILCLPFAALFAGVAISGGSSGITIVFMLFLALLCVVGGVYYLIVYPLIHGAWRIYSCTDGFLFLKGSQPIPCRWDQVAFVWQRIVRHYTNGVYTGTTFKYTICRADGFEIIIDQKFRSASQLGTQAQREVTRRLTPQAVAAFNAGQTLQFGPFNVSRQGLATPKEVIPWSEVQQVSANRGMVVIQRRGQRKAKSYGGVDKVPNLYVFFNVAEAIVQKR